MLNLSFPLNCIDGKCVRQGAYYVNGMATWAEIADAVQAFRAAGGSELVLLKCTSAYPADPAEMNLRTIPDLVTSFGEPAGLSDHTLGIEVTIAAVALGACVIEKYITLSRAVPGPDSAFSLEPPEFKALVDAVRLTEQALGRVNCEPFGKEVSNRLLRKSLFVVKPISAGELITMRNVRSIRPGHGLLPKYYSEILGRRAKEKIAPGTPLAWSLIE